MKFFFLFIPLFLLLNPLHGQDTVARRPEYVIVIDNKIVSKEKLEEYAKHGYVRAMRKGVSEEERDRLVRQFGDRIGDKEFVILISLFTEEEKRANELREPVPANAADTVLAEDEFISRVNDAATDFTVDMLDGETVRLSDLKGKVVLVNFWATWCAPCLMEFYDFPSSIIKPFKDKPFVFLAISRGETREKVARKMLALKQDGIDFNVGLDPDETIWKRFAKGAIPKNFLIDQDGVIRYVSVGYSKGNVERLAEEIAKLLSP